jgi:protein TonB
LNPAALGSALLVNGGIIAVLATLGAVTVIPRGGDTIETYRVPIETPPPPQPVEKLEPVKPTVETPPRPSTIDIVRPVIEAPPTGPVVTGPTEPVLPPSGPTTGTLGGTGTGSGTIVDPPMPVIVDATVDPRHSSAFQPDYPGRELGLGEEGIVTVRVLIGVDGRVKAVERVSADTDGFFQATRRHALARWRFRPATRDGVPQEVWKKMTVRFRIN